MIKNNEVKTVENNPYIVSTKNNEKTDKMNIEVKNKFKPDKKTTNITSKKEITKINKTNMKNEGNVIDSITSQNPSLADDTITIISSGKVFSDSYSVSITLNDTLIVNTTVMGSNWILQPFTFKLPEVDTGTYTLKIMAVSSRTYSG